MSNFDKDHNHHNTAMDYVEGEFVMINRNKKIKKVEGTCGCTALASSSGGIKYRVNLKPVKEVVHKRFYEMGKKSYDKSVSIRVFYEDQKDPDYLTVTITKGEQSSKVSDQS